MAKLYVKNEWQDEILAGDERLDIKADDGTPIEENVQITLRTSVIQAGTPVDAAKMNNIENGIDALDTLVSDHGDMLAALLTGWIKDSDTWVYVSATQLKIVGKDVRSRFPVGTKLRLTQGTVKYFYAIAAGMSGSDTLITLTGGSDYALANAAISSPYYSYAAAPQGFPQWFNYQPTVVGISGTAGSFAANPYLGRFALQGRICYVQNKIKITDLGSWSSVLRVTLPVAPAGTMLTEIPSTGFITAHATNPATASLGVPNLTAGSIYYNFLSSVDTASVTFAQIAAGINIRTNLTYEI